MTKPINTSGFKIALELLLKSRLATGASLAQVPYSFGVRKVGSSKLSSKVMLRYVGQLVTLYAWAWGIFFHAMIGSACAFSVILCQLVWREVQYARHSESLLPGGLSGKRKRPPLESKRLV